eukprot:TRINITY_DN54292_c0_g1_i1.p1 TRINITY_DN54292_c0_g1~~TRINITY_DN54292_c0_g1_i1.p1  ORF type:complete len:229 (-),score=27.15 TRINITY_DN54292_c0_g1_i1:294-980(-)
MAPLTGLKAVLFDIDGTLVESDPLHHFAFNETLTAYGVPQISEAVFYKQVSGTHIPYALAEMFPDWSEEKRLKFTDDKEAKFRELGTKLEPTKGLDEICNWIDTTGLAKATVTNSPRPNAELLLKAIQRREYFETLVIGEECPRAKPYPDPYIIAMHILGVKPEQVVVVEDSVSGVKAGLSSGATVIGITSGRSSQELKDLGCSYTIADFKELTELLKSMFSSSCQAC